MGRGTINTELGDGEYTIDVDYGTLVLEERISQIDARLAEISDIIDNIDTALTEKNVVFLAAKQTLDDAINFYRTALMVDPEGAADEKAAVDLATTGFFDVRGEYEVLARLKKQYEIEQLNLQERKGYLEAFDLSDTIQVWCADYTLQASGNVSTIEVPGEPATTLISPGAQVPVDADGLVTARVAQQSYQSYWNLGALPAWQKYLPTYRFGTLTFIDRGENTATVDLDPATSTADGGTGTPLNINQDDTLLDVPFEYMTCNHRAFTVGDEVVVKFTDQDWSQPKVIGFKSNPNPCGWGVLRSQWLFDSWPTSGESNMWVAYDEADILEELRNNRAAPQITVEWRRGGDEEWITIPLTAYNLTTSAPIYPIGWVWSEIQEYQPGIFRNIIRVQILDKDWAHNVLSYAVTTTDPGSIVCYQDFETWPMYLRIDRAAYNLPVGFEEIVAADQVDEVRITLNATGVEYFHLAMQTRTGLFYGARDIDQLTVEETDPMLPDWGPSETIDFLEDYNYPPDP